MIELYRARLGQVIGDPGGFPVYLQNFRTQFGSDLGHRLTLREAVDRLENEWNAVVTTGDGVRWQDRRVATDDITLLDALSETMVLSFKSEEDLTLFLLRWS